MRADPAEVERLLSSERRARLPFARQLVLYLDPFAFFKDASRGPLTARQFALSYNRVMRWMLIAATLFLGIAPSEALAAQASFFIYPAAAFALGSCLAIAVTTLTVAVYLLLGSRKQ